MIKDINKKTTRQSRKRNITHCKLMHNAKRLFEQKGLGNVTIEEITEATDVARSTFFSHFDNMEALITEIASIAVKDIIDAYQQSGKSGKEGIIALFDKLIEDTCPYPYLAVELFTNYIIKAKGKTAFYSIENLINTDLLKEIQSNRYTRDEQTALILGAYFGVVFQKLIKGEPFDRPDDIKKLVKKHINNIIGD